MGCLSDAARVSVAALFVFGALVTGCSSDATPPMVEQIRLSEIVSNGQDAVARTVFGFGSHPDAAASEAHVVTTAEASANRLRVIVNKRLAGNTLEEIECRYVVDDDVFAPMPAGLVPDDVARCAVAQDQLASQCPGSSPRALCVCQNDDGCPSGSNPDGSDHVTPKGQSVGVQDRDQDGTSDAMQLIGGRVALTCGSFAVAIDQAASFWTPSGGQDFLQAGSFDQLGPALVIVPKAPLPTGQACKLALTGVTDDDGVALCAPPDGELDRGCAPGDTSAFGFTVEPMSFFAHPAVDAAAQSRTDAVLIQAAAPVDASTLAGLTVVEGTATPYTQFTAALAAPTVIRIQWTVGLAAHTRYTIVVPTSVTDLYHLSAPLPVQISFTTSG